LVAFDVPTRLSHARGPRRFTSTPIWRYTLRAVAIAQAERSGNAARPIDADA